MDNQIMNQNQNQPANIQPTSPKKTKIKPWWIILAVVVIVVIAGVSRGVSIYNDLAQESQSVDSAWSEIDNQMQRRYELVPNLVNTVKGSMKQEKDVFLGIADARKQYGIAKSPEEKMDANGKLQTSVGALINVIQENYPELGSNGHVKTLMNQLEGSENRVSVARTRYNREVESYNKSVVTFPKSIFADMMGLGKKPYFKAEKGAEKAPKVDFD